MKYLLFSLLFLTTCTSTPQGIAPVSTLPADKSGKVHPVAGQLAAYNLRDINMFAIYFHEDIKLYRLGETQPFVSSRAQLRETYGRMFAKTPNLHCKIIRRMVTADFVIDEEIVSGMKKDSYVHAIAIYEVKGGTITRAWFIKDR
ncbi:nuclear transport factor 2 family protein [Myxococcota bacterium]|nr:nuclear transport factor 2 family protein [Myxococcota bacterium]MBU1380827.1 nuclear transport factor 2 family protein [Myxococcota bacterium]MBU1496540.1 nuclear transport factor 2 family protein [Myxococcota bacterium]